MVSDYAKYLKSEHWQSVRGRALLYAENRCQLCNSNWSIDVHHRTYVRLGCEQDNDVFVLCRGCHQHFHNRIAKGTVTDKRLSKGSRKGNPLSFHPERYPDDYVRCQISRQLDQVKIMLTQGLEPEEVLTSLGHTRNSGPMFGQLVELVRELSGRNAQEPKHA